MIAAGMRIGKYELTRQLGRGGFGVVFVATDHSLGRECALKFLLPEHTARTDLLERFVQEARTAAQIRHLGIVTVFECGVFADTETSADGTAYIAMELLEGESLAARLARTGAVSELAAIVIARQVAAALGAAHDDGVVHRDLKPDNIFLVPDPAAIGGERVKVLDFGIAKLAETTEATSQTATYAVFGTPRYMSPEQCRSTTNVDARADVYALGCIMFELVCGRAPFIGESGEQIAHHQLSVPPTVRSIRPQISEAFDATVAAMLAKRPDDRPAAMAEVIRLLDHHASVTGSAQLAVGTGPPPAAMRSNPNPPPALPSVPAPSAILERTPEPVPLTVSPRRWPIVLGGVVAVAGILGGFAIARRSAPPAPLAVPTDARIDAAPPSAEAIALDKECRQYAASEAWSKLAECGELLRAAGDPDRADEHVATSRRELVAMGVAREITESIARLASAEQVAALYAELDPTSRYQKTIRSQIHGKLRNEANQLADYHQCAALDAMREHAKQLPSETFEEVQRTVCLPRGDISAVDCATDTPVAAREALASEKFGPALAKYAEYIDCRDNRAQPTSEATLVDAIRAACRLRIAVMARLYFDRIPDDRRALATAEVVGECKNTGVPLP